MSRDVPATFAQIAQMAERTGKIVQKAMNPGGSQTSGAAGMGRQFRSAASEAERAVREISKQMDREFAAVTKAANAERKTFQKTQAERIKGEEKVVREREKSLAQMERIQDKFLRQETRNQERETAKREKIEERAAKKIERDRDRFATRTSHRAVRFLFPNPIGAFGMASRIGGDIMRGAGVDFSVAGSVGRAVGLQSLATQLSNQGYMPGEKGANGTRVASSVLENEARATAKAQAMDPEAMLRAQTKFVDLTGNLGDARAAMPKIAALSGATGTDPEKMAEAWANVSRHIGEVPNKAEKVYGLMKLIAGQGRVGSIEIKDEAKDLGKIAAMADKYTGDRASTIGKLTTLAQLGKAEGGAASSAQAATSIVSFTNTFQSGARVKAMLAAGLKEEDIFHMQGTGKNRIRGQIQDPFEIIKKTLQVTGGDISKFGNIFKSVMSQRATNSLVAAYNSGGGRNMGAVDEKLAQFGKEATLTDKQVDDNNAERLKTDAAKAQEFQNAMDEVISQTKNELTPALIQLKEPALQAAHYLAEMVGWAAKNPLEAVGVAITGAIARAGIESAFRAGIEKAIANAGGSGLEFMAPVAITIAAATVVMHLIDEDIKDHEKQQGGDAMTSANQGAASGKAAADARSGKYSQSDKSADQATEDDLKSRLSRVDKLKGNQYGVYDKNPGDFMLGMENFLNPEKSRARGDAAHEGELRAELAKVHQRLAGNLNVTVMNASEIANAGPRVPAAGRDLDPGHLPSYLRR